jgi:GT2 family glycosyltransferase
MDLTIVMAYWNRKQQLLNTLKSIDQYGHDYKMIIIDDVSTDNQDITCLNSDKIKVVTLKNKWWINPCIPYNIGFSMVDTDIVLIQNPECYHVGDIIGHTLRHIKDGVYLNYGAYSISTSLVDKITSGESIKDVIMPTVNGPSTAPTELGWYNHSLYRPIMLHFCSAITSEDLYDLGGFDERYADGLAFDDNEFICRVQKKGMHVDIIDDPFVVHQQHSVEPHDNLDELMFGNSVRLGQTNISPLYDVKPFNKFYK